MTFIPRFADESNERDWAIFDVAILDQRPDREGEAVFRQDGISAPASWSQRAVQVAASKYFHGEQGTDRREESVYQLVDRVVAQIADWGHADGYFDSPDSANAFREELRALCLGQYASFNSPVWFNVGLSRSYKIGGSPVGYRWESREDAGHTPGVVPCEDAYRYPQASACFIQGVEDSLPSIMELARSEAMLFKYGSGSGTDLSTIRSRKEKLEGGGTPSGPISFMGIYDAVAKVVKSGGKTRRAAKMQTLRCDHPDIRDFIQAKPTEDRKARDLIARGYSADMDGEAYSSVLFQNCNMSVRLTDQFLRLADNPRPAGGVFPLKAVTTGETIELVDASDLLDEIAQANWECGDPGLQYEDTIQEWHTCPNTAPINSSNPCSEYMFIDDTACNLSSINLLKFRRDDGTFDIEGFRHAVRVMLAAQEILVDHASYPTAKIAENSHKFRPLGLGYANLGAYVMASGLAYDSDEGRSLAGAITAIMTAQAYQTSAEIAEYRGAFDGFAANRGPMLKVIAKHKAACEDEADKTAPFDENGRLWEHARHHWLIAGYLGGRGGYRNSQVTLLAPTGTIAFMMDCATTGIEPPMGLVATKALVGGGTMRIANSAIRLGFEAIMGKGNEEVDAAVARVDEYGTLKGLDAALGGGWLDSHPDAERRIAIFDCAFPDPGTGRSIAWQGHVKMMAAVQPFLSGAISKTCNLPADATVADIRGAYLEAWKLGLKSLSIYRDGSKGCQPMTVAKVDSVEVASTDCETKIDPDTVQTLIERANALGFNLVEDPAGWLAKAERTVVKLAQSLGIWDEFAESFLTGQTDEFDLFAQLVMQMAQGREPTRERLPDDREAKTHKFDIQGHEGYINVGLYPDGRPGEVFVRMAREGSTLGGLLDTLAISLSIGLQSGIPLSTYCRKFIGQRFEPSGFTKDPSIPVAKSIVDYLGRFLGSRYCPDMSPAEIGLAYRPGDILDVATLAPEGKATPGPVDPENVASPPNPPGLNINVVGPCEGPTPSIAAPDRKYPVRSDGPPCSYCYGMTEPAGSCWRCLTCGGTSGCS